MPHGNTHLSSPRVLSQDIPQEASFEPENKAAFIHHPVAQRLLEIEASVTLHGGEQKKRKRKKKEEAEGERRGGPKGELKVTQLLQRIC